VSDLISKTFLVGLGLASLTKDAIQKAVEDLVDQSKISEAEGRRLAKDLQRRSARARKALEQQADGAVHQVLTKLDLPTMIINRLQGTKPAKKRTRKARPARPGRRPRGAKKVGRR
jgi:polyhydroxyalkanoate synthesis regulator phasin